MPQPGDQGEHRHGGAHAQVGNHFPVVGKGVGDGAVQQAEQDNERLPCRIALCVEDQGGDPDQGGGKGHPAFPVECQERQQNAAHGAAPQEPLPLGEIRCDGLLHRLPSKKISTPAHLPRPNDVRECCTTRWQFVYAIFTVLIITETN